ncbi:hypothetical protein FQN60_005919 [Etheostoma spectabile]|uniref:Uncharacterized protein n=1 Tax=Etheostoma spectabile TaxID=54343 RepID=A0A5J5CEL5_9PERO|nr:hypothetical protein FQN60_005919 [Etheostoma spectabile]
MEETDEEEEKKRLDQLATSALQQMIDHLINRCYWSSGRHRACSLARAMAQIRSMDMKTLRREKDGGSEDGREGKVMEKAKFIHTSVNCGDERRCLNHEDKLLLSTSCCYDCQDGHAEDADGKNPNPNQARAPDLRQLLRHDRTMTQHTNWINANMSYAGLHRPVHQQTPEDLQTHHHWKLKTRLCRRKEYLRTLKSLYVNDDLDDLFMAHQGTVQHYKAQQDAAGCSRAQQDVAGPSRT